VGTPTIDDRSKSVASKGANMKSVGGELSFQMTQWEEIFLALSKVSSVASNFEELLNLLVSLLVESVHPADAGIVYLYDDRHQQLVAEASYGYDRSNIKYSLRLREGAPGRCYAMHKPLLFSTVEAVMEQTASLRPENLDCHAKLREGLPPTLSMVTIPLVAGENIFGVILLEHYKEHRPFSDADLLQLKALSSWISLIIDDMQSHLELKQSKRSYRELLGKFITTNEEERRKIAREIHDEVNQLLLSVMLNLEDIEGALPAELVEVRERLRVNRSHINQAFDDLRELSFRLRPPALDELGLPQALEWYVDSLSKEAGLSITLRVSGLSQRRPAPVVEMELFRIAQEALSNVIKHARAASARVKLDLGKSRLVLLVEDSGTGFDPSALLNTSGSNRSLGLLGMMERAELCGGTLKIDSSPGSGTRLRVEIPVSSYDWGAY
jgi:signal transduction histidine kinase